MRQQKTVTRLRRGLVGDFGVFAHIDHRNIGDPAERGICRRLDRLNLQLHGLDPRFADFEGEFIVSEIMRVRLREASEHRFVFSARGWIGEGMWHLKRLDFLTRNKDGGSTMWLDVHSVGVVEWLYLDSEGKLCR